jgi:hypothetical protein
LLSLSAELVAAVDTHVSFGNNSTPPKNMLKNSIEIGSVLAIKVDGEAITATVVAIGPSELIGRSVAVATIQHPIKSSGYITIDGIEGGCGNAASRIANQMNVIDVLIPTDRIRHD